MTEAFLNLAFHHVLHFIGPFKHHPKALRLAVRPTDDLTEAGDDRKSTEGEGEALLTMPGENTDLFSCAGHGGCHESA